MKRIRVPAEVVYVLAILLLSFSVAMAASTDFGISMIAAPAFILSEKLPLTFGQCEYVVQGLLFVVFCILMKKVRLVYFSSFLTGIVYGAVLDLWRILIPHFNPAVTAPGTLPQTASRESHTMTSAASIGRRPVSAAVRTMSVILTSVAAVFSSAFQ